MNNILPMMNNNNYGMNTPSFKGLPKKPSTFASLATRATLGAKKFSKWETALEEKIAEKVIAPLMNSKAVDKLTDKIGKSEKMTDHMSAAGSFVTTAAYAGTTLNNKNMEKKPARTLALNQFLVTALSTVGTYTINGSIAKFTKKMSYKFSDVNQGLEAAKLSKRVKGFPIVQKLLTFSIIYRYVAPVLVTPAASKIGKALNSEEKVATKTPVAVAKK